MIADPEPKVPVLPLDRQSAVFERNPNRPDFLASPFPQFLELQRTMVRILLQKGKLFVGARVRAVERGTASKTTSGLVVHQSLERLDATVLLVI